MSPALDGYVAPGKSIGHIWNETAKSVSLQDRLTESGIHPQLVGAVCDLGSYAVDHPFIEDKLESLQCDYGLRAILLAAGWAIISDRGRGLWPTATFRNAWISFKEKHTGSKNLLDSNNFFNLLALSLSCPELVDEKLRAQIEKERLKRGDRYGTLTIANDLRRFNDEGFRALQMVGSYLGGRPDLPWGEADVERIATAIHKILITIVDEKIEFQERRKNNGYSGDSGPPRMATWDELFKPAAAFDVNHAFRNAVHIDWGMREGILDLPMPESAVRLNIEMPCDDGDTHLAHAARAFARIVADGHHVSAKFTMSDHNGDRRFWDRLCIYVPTCAVPTTMKAFLPLFYEERLQWTQSLMNKQFPGDYFILLPRFCSLRGTGEGGATSSTQFQESLETVASLGITHQVLRKI